MFLPYKLPHMNRSALFLTVLLSLAWVIPGLIGHAPWKPDEAYSFGLVYHFYQTGEWVIPTLAGEPFMEKPPFFYLSATLMGRAFSPFLPLHDAFRLTTGIFIGITLLFTSLGAKELLGESKKLIVVPLLLGCIGMLVRGHEMITDNALLAGFAISIYGVALCLRRPKLGGVLFGTGVGIGFMSKGLIAPGVLGVTALLLPILFKTWRTKNYLATLLLATLAALPWLTIWPFFVYQHSPALFYEWFWVNNFGRYLGFVQLGGSHDHSYYFETLPWFAWPVWPFAFWSLWMNGLKGLKQPNIQLPLILLSVLLAVLVSASDAREVYALPILLPLTLLAANGIDSLPQNAAKTLDRLATIVFSLVSGFLWILWISLFTGWPPKLIEKIYQIQPQYVPEISAITLSVALIYSAIWVLLLSYSVRSNYFAIVKWTSGITLTWCLLATIWLPWIDMGKSYQSMFQDMQKALPAKFDCISSLQLGEPQRALIQYYLGIVTYREETKRRDCDLMLFQGAVETPPNIDMKWKELWNGARPGDQRERYRLYIKNN
jgi:4-amino-4-deoxy-L-arabinose transferase-like glycosyltransferase